MLYQKIYLNLIKQQQEQDAKSASIPTTPVKQPKKFKNLLKRVKHDDSDQITIPRYKFGGKGLEWEGLDYCYETLDKHQFSDNYEQDDIQLSNYKRVYDILIDGPIEFKFSWHPEEPQTWNYPGRSEGITDIYDFSFPFTYSLSDPKNNDIIKIYMYDEETDEDCDVKFTELSTKDKKIVLNAIIKYFQSSEFQQWFENYLIEKRDIEKKMRDNDY